MYLRSKECPQDHICVTVLQNLSNYSKPRTVYRVQNDQKEEWVIKFTCDAERHLHKFLSVQKDIGEYIVPLQKEWEEGSVDGIHWVPVKVTLYLADTSRKRFFKNKQEITRVADAIETKMQAYPGNIRENIDWRSIYNNMVFADAAFYFHDFDRSVQ